MLYPWIQWFLTGGQQCVMFRSGAACAGGPHPAGERGAHLFEYWRVAVPRCPAALPATGPASPSWGTLRRERQLWPFCPHSALHHLPPPPSSAGAWLGSSSWRMTWTLPPAQSDGHVRRPDQREASLLWFHMCLRDPSSDHRATHEAIFDLEVGRKNTSEKPALVL